MHMHMHVHQTSLAIQPPEWALLTHHHDMPQSSFNASRALSIRPLPGNNNTRHSSLSTRHMHLHHTAPHGPKAAVDTSLHTDSSFSDASVTNPVICPRPKATPYPHALQL